MADIVSVLVSSGEHLFTEQLEVGGRMNHAASVPTKSLAINKQCSSLVGLKVLQVFVAKWEGLRRQEHPVHRGMIPQILRGLWISSIVPFHACVLNAPPLHNVMNECILARNHHGLFPYHVSSCGMDGSWSPPGAPDVCDDLKASLFTFNCTGDIQARVDGIFNASDIGYEHLAEAHAGFDLALIIFFAICNNQIGLEFCNGFEVRGLGSSYVWNVPDQIMGAHAKFRSTDQGFCYTEIDKVFCPTWHETDNPHRTNVV